MIEEKEIKIRLLDDINLVELKSIIENLFELKFTEIKYQKDTYIDLKNNFYFKLNQGLRIRNDVELAYKALFYLPNRTSNPWFVLEKEHKIPIFKKDLLELFAIANINCNLPIKNELNFFELKQLFKKLNFFEHIKINKKRFIAKNELYEICIDFVEALGLFLELEATDEKYLSYFKNKVPFKYEEIRHGYTNLYAKEVMNIDIPDFKKLFLSTPNWNFLSGQKEIIENLTKK